jgi:hypothetical protein
MLVNVVNSDESYRNVGLSILSNIISQVLLNNILDAWIPSQYHGDKILSLSLYTFYFSVFGQIPCYCIYYLKGRQT